MKTKLMTRTVLLVSMAALTPVAIAQSNASSKPGTGATGAAETNDRTDRTYRTGANDRTATGERAKIQSGSLTTVIADSTSFSTLTKALKAAGLDETLGGKDEFTVFAPTDEAFGKLPPGTLDKLVLPENKEKLRMLLLYHVVAGRVQAADMTDGEVKTVNGEKLEVDVSGDKIEVDGAKVYSADVSATNGVMHSIGKVLVPKSLEGFSGLKN